MLKYGKRIKPGLQVLSVKCLTVANCMFRWFSDYPCVLESLVSSEEEVDDSQFKSGEGSAGLTEPGVELAIVSRANPSGLGKAD